MSPIVATVVGILTGLKIIIGAVWWLWRYQRRPGHRRGGRWYRHGCVDTASGNSPPAGAVWGGGGGGEASRPPFIVEIRGHLQGYLSIEKAIIEGFQMDSRDSLAGGLPRLCCPTGLLSSWPRLHIRWHSRLHPAIHEQIDITRGANMGVWNCNMIKRLFKFGKKPRWTTGTLTSLPSQLCLRQQANPQIQDPDPMRLLLVSISIFAHLTSSIRSFGPEIWPVVGQFHCIHWSALFQVPGGLVAYPGFPAIGISRLVVVIPYTVKGFKIIIGCSVISVLLALSALTSEGYNRQLTCLGLCVG